LLTVGLTTAAGAQTGSASPGAREQAGDAWITTKIQAAYFLDADVKGRTIDVTTANGIVTLAGRVENQREHDQAVSIARTTDGVKQVVDKLAVGSSVGTTGRTEPAPAPGSEPSGDPDRPSIPGSDEISRVAQSDPVILTQIKTQLAVDPDVSAFGIDVDVDDGVVTLKGNVKSENARAKAVSIARSVGGVKKVVDNLTIRQ
jgi:osmotically-inducible protein OsmY